ncbi:MAG TPA: archaetidylserine decarboxylase [Steroidobacteraceae bacterium]
MSSPLLGRVFVGLQYVLPQHTLSRLVYHLTRSRIAWLKNALIGWFTRSYRPDMSECLLAEPLAYPSFNAFFTRALRPGARPLSPDSYAIASPVDGAVSMAGPIEQDRLLQAKGQYYTLAELLAESTDSGALFEAGWFATLYLAPFNYHRIHMPIEGVLRGAWHVPGSLFSVNATTATRVPRLFARNERVVCLFDSPYGPFAMVLVGALFVGSISTVWHRQITPRRAGGPSMLPEAPRQLLARGEEFARFNMGSTVILLLPAQLGSWAAHLSPGSAVRVGQSIGRLAAAVQALH